MKKLFLTALLTAVILPLMATSYVWDRQKMELYRTQPNEHVAAAIKGIIRDADKKLADPIPDITDKTHVAPSGDKHDYFSMARYWWPNPKTADHLPYIRQDGKVNPETEDLDRRTLDAMEKMLTVYALAYFSNSGLLDGYSFLIVPDAVDILSASKSAKQKDIAAIRQWFTDYLEWMLTSPQGVKEDVAENNHGTAYHIQVAVYALFVGNDSVAQPYLNSFVERRIVPQVELDGRQPKELARTRGYGYSCYNLKHYLDMMDICRLQGIDLLAHPNMQNRIAKAIDFLTPYLGRPVSAWPFQQIAQWEKEQQNLCWVLYRANAYFPDKGYMQLFDTYNTAKPSTRYYLVY